MKHRIPVLLFFTLLVAGITLGFVKAKQQTTQVFIFGQKLLWALPRNYDFTLNGTQYKLHTGKTMQSTLSADSVILLLQNYGPLKGQYPLPFRSAAKDSMYIILYYGANTNKNILAHYAAVEVCKECYYEMVKKYGK
jgi:hypothetical protein